MPFGFFKRLGYNSLRTRCSQQKLQTWKTCRFEFYLSKSRNSLVPTSAKTLTKKNLAENLDKTWNVKIYTIFIFYLRIFSKFCTPTIVEYLWHLPFGANIVCTKTWRMAILTWTKPGDNLELYGSKSWEPWHGLSIMTI